MSTKLSILAPVTGFASYVAAGNGVHLTNCQTLGSSGYDQSRVIYCNDDSNCNKYPSDDFCIPGVSPQNWEAGGSCTFSDTGVTFSWDLAADSQSHANYSAVGGANNGQQQFTCYKDDQNAMFTQNGVHCNSIYYCI